MDQLIEASRPAASKAYGLILAAGLLLVLGANLPGHLSLDSVIALDEARNGVRLTWAPAAFSWVLHLCDRVVAGTGFYVTASSALLFVSLISLRALRPRSSWAAVAVAVAAVATPQLLIYQGIVWRDVLFANLSVAGFVFLAHAARHWPAQSRWPALIGALVCLALAALIRQNGAVMALAGAAVLAWTARSGGWRSALAWGAGGLVAMALVAGVISILARPHQIAPKLRQDAATLILQHYDVVGAVAHDPGLKLETIARANPASARIIEAAAARLYTPARIDTLDLDATVRQTLWHVPDAAMRGQWREVVLRHPGAYLRHRADAFRWVLATPTLALCLPVQVGVAGPQPMIDALQVTAAPASETEALAAYARRFYETPVYSHLTYAAIAAVALALLLWRRDPADCVVAAMLLGTAGFVASFFLISVACDYRYLYLLDLAAISAALYVALDPRFGQRKAT